MKRGAHHARDRTDARRLRQRDRDTLGVDPRGQLPRRTGTSMDTDGRGAASCASQQGLGETLFGPGGWGAQARCTRRRSMSYDASLMELNGMMPATVAPSPQ